MADNDSRAGARYYNEAILDYTQRVHASHDAGLTRAFATPDGVPAIQLGMSEGKLVHLLVKMIGARKAVEVGTLVGYSGTQIARALAPGGHLWTCEFDPRHAELARANFAAAGVGDRVTIVVGPGVETLPTLNAHGPFDVVFIDADKQNYEHYGAWAIANLRPGGLVLGDNAFLFGQLCDDDARARAMRRFHEGVAAACDSVCIPTPDGLVLGIKR